MAIALTLWIHPFSRWMTWKKAAGPCFQGREWAWNREKEVLCFGGTFCPTGCRISGPCMERAPSSEAPSGVCWNRTASSSRITSSFSSFVFFLVFLFLFFLFSLFYLFPFFCLYFLLLFPILDPPFLLSLFTFSSQTRIGDLSDGVGGVEQGLLLFLLFHSVSLSAKARHAAAWRA